LTADWKYKNVEASDAALSAKQASGIILIILAVILFFVL
jgi:hypothetical protein